MVQTLIKPDDLVDIALEAQKQGVNLRAEPAYQNPDSPLNHVFREAIYKPDARMWVHKDLASIVLTAARRCWKETGLHFVLADCLRTTDAQKRMMETKIVRANPHWIAPGPRQLLSMPGGGAHPRAMAIDIFLEDAQGNPIDMGTVFDHFSTDPNNNPAARDYPHAEHIMKNRAMLTDYVLQAAKELGKDILPLPSEWWDFRFPPEIYEQYAPLSDADLPVHMRMCAQ